jgi:imidazoleglycerol phosphate synthase glutamine amidotransferase subunit HisH
MVGRTNNGISFCSVIDNKEGVFGVQFHPEKSRMNGLKIIQNFLEIRKC